MAAPVVVTSNVFGGTTATSHSGTWPATLSGDYFVLYVGLDKGSATATTINTPTGLTDLIVQGTAGLTAYNIAKAFYRLCDGTETGSFTTTYSSSSLAGGVWALVRGADIPSTWANDPTVYQVGTDNKLDPLVSNSVTTTATEALLFGLVAWDESKTLTTAPSGFTALGHLDVSGLDVRGDYKTLSAAGATGTISWDISSATRYNALTLAMPAPAAAGGVSGSMAATETGPDTFAGAGSVAVSGALAAQETGSDTLAASGAVAVSGSLAVTEAGSDTFAATGTVTNAGAVTGSMSATEAGSDTFAGTGINANPITPVAPPSGGGGGFYPAQHHSFTNKDVRRIERMLFPKRKKRKPVKEIVAEIQDIAPDVNPVIIRQKVVVLERSLADTPMQQDLAVLEKATKTMLEALMALQDDEDIEQILLFG